MKTKRTSPNKQTVRYRLYQDKEMERSSTSPNVLEQHDVGNERVDYVANEGEDLRSKPTAALGTRPWERQPLPPLGNQRKYEWPRESPRDRRLRSPGREERPRTSHYYPRNPAYLENPNRNTRAVGISITSRKNPSTEHTRSSGIYRWNHSTAHPNQIARRN